MQNNIFERVKERVSMLEVAKFYGFEPNRAGFVRCAFHNEKTPSCKLYDRNFFCFGCQTGGTIVDFTSKLFNLTPIDAVKKINSDFNLGLSLESHAPTREEVKAAAERERIRKITQAFERWQGEANEQLTACIFLANEALKRKTPDKWTDGEIQAIKYRAELESYADILLWDDMSAKFALFQSRKEVASKCARILKA